MQARRASFMPRGDGPAPGAYDPTRRDPAPAWTMPGAPRNLEPGEVDPTPAPGEYNSHVSRSCLYACCQA